MSGYIKTRNPLQIAFVVEADSSTSGREYLSETYSSNSTIQRFPRQVGSGQSGSEGNNMRWTSTFPGIIIGLVLALVSTAQVHAQQRVRPKLSYDFQFTVEETSGDGTTLRRSSEEPGYQRFTSFTWRGQSFIPSGWSMVKNRLRFDEEGRPMINICCVRLCAKRKLIGEPICQAGSGKFKAGERPDAVDISCDGRERPWC
ncbi:MAG: hypothetical protein M1823_004803 [Watsoniomyces obsoletus]|nr:MAG: hypothetical protein M1823_004803 [Watsoniomyces obsoletus]